MFYITALTATVLLLGTSSAAHAYIDPGSGSYMLQMALAGILAVVFSLKMFWQRLRTNVTSHFRTSKRHETPSGK
jgi:hypothetical protein